jgi:uncharacterized repeat protein (TIGR02543 family)
MDQHTFRGWFTKESPADNAQAFNFANTPITGPLILHAAWKWSPVYTVTLERNGGNTDSGSFQSTHNVVLGETLSSLPDNLIKEGYSFQGWHTDAAMNNKITSVSPIANMTLYAKWNKEANITVRVWEVWHWYDRNSKSGAVYASVDAAGNPVSRYYTHYATYSVPYNGKIPRPADLTLSHLNIKTPSDSEASFDNYRAFYRWIDISKTTSAERGTGSLPSGVDVDFDKRITTADKPATSFSPNIEIGGWYQGNMLPLHTLRLNRNGGFWEGAGRDRTFTARHGTLFTVPADVVAPLREGYSFQGWFDNAACTDAMVDRPVFGDVTIYAKWKQEPNFTIEFRKIDNAFAESWSPRTVPYGAKIPKPSTYPTYPGVPNNRFVGWFVNGNGDSNRKWIFGTDRVYEQFFLKQKFKWDWDPGNWNEPYPGWND